MNNNMVCLVVDCFRDVDKPKSLESFRPKTMATTPCSPREFGHTQTKTRRLTPNAISRLLSQWTEYIKVALCEQWRRYTAINNATGLRHAYVSVFCPWFSVVKPTVIAGQPLSLGIIIVEICGRGVVCADSRGLLTRWVRLTSCHRDRFKTIYFIIVFCHIHTR